MTNYIARRTFTYNGRLIVRGQPWVPARLRVDGSIIRTKMVEAVSDDQQSAEELPETSQDKPVTDQQPPTTARDDDDEAAELLGEPDDVSDDVDVVGANTDRDDEAADLLGEPEDVSDDSPIREADQVEALHPTSEAAAPAAATSRKRTRKVNNGT